jgi:hypothetical protein
MIEGLVIFVVLALISVVVGVVFGRVVAAPAIRHLADRADADEESGDPPA